MTRTGALLVVLAVVAIFLALSAWWGAPIYLLHAGVVLGVTAVATYGVNRRRRAPRH